MFCGTKASSSNDASYGLSSSELSDCTTISRHRQRFGFRTGFSDRYALGKQISKGAEGCVYVAMDRVTQDSYAVKVVRKQFSPDGTLASLFRKQLRHEIDIGKRLSNSLAVARLYGVYEDDLHVLMVIEMCTGGELWERMEPDTYTERQAAFLIHEVVRVIALCHSNGVILRDVKPDNFVFLNKDDTSPLKAIDFGSAEYCRPGQYLTEKAGTPIFMAPEVYCRRYTLSADMWSAGMVAYMLLAGRLPWAGPLGMKVNDLYMGKKLFTRRDAYRAATFLPLDFSSHPWDMLPAEARDLVQSLLQRDPAKRPTAREALQHHWLQVTLRRPPDIGCVSLGPDVVQRVQRFGMYGRLKQAALRSVVRSIAADADLLQQLRANCAALDPDGTGRIPYDRLVGLLTNGGFTLSRQEVCALVGQLDMDMNGDIDYDAWIAAMVDWRKIQDTPGWDQWVAAAFRAFDLDSDGAIDAQELSTALYKGDMQRGRDSLRGILHDVDGLAGDGDSEDEEGADGGDRGRISLAQFTQLLRADRPFEDLELFDTRMSVAGD